MATHEFLDITGKQLPRMKTVPLIMLFCPEPFLWLHYKVTQKGGVEYMASLGQNLLAFMYNLREMNLSLCSKKQNPICPTIPTMYRCLGRSILSR